MLDLWVYIFGSVLVVSLISFVGLFALSVKMNVLRKILIYLISFSAGALLGDAFIHLLPEMAEQYGFSLEISSYILGGIVVFFVLEKIIHWQHCHEPISEEHVHSFAYMNLVGDGLHNFLDGLIIAGSYLVSVPVGIATTVAVILHEIPQEIGDFGVLIHGGFSRGKALLFNFLSALTAVLGAVVALWLSNIVSNLEYYLVPIAVGGFIYIAGSDLIPEIHKERNLTKSILQTIAFLAGIGVMALLLFLE